MQYILNEVKPCHHFFCITFALKGKIPLLKNDVCFVLLFHSYGRAYCIHATMYLPKSIIYIHFYFTIMILYIIAYFSVNWFTALSRYIGSFAHTGANTFFKEDHIHLKGFHSDILLSFFHFFFKGALHSCLFEKDFGFMSNKCCTPLCKGTVQNDATLCKERCDFMLGTSYCWENLTKSQKNFQ